jgi:hypothetical protein
MRKSTIEPEEKPQVVPLRPEDIAYDTDNPRGESPQEIEADPTYTQLRDSVFQYGVLVPIVVHPQPAGATKKYRLVDGERRLRAALANHKKWIPARIVKPKRQLDNVIQEFHIHMLRKQWNPPAMTRALIRLLKYKNWDTGRKLSNAELEELQSLTGCTDTQLRSLRRGARYPDNVLKQIEAKKIRWSHLIQIEESLVEPIEQFWPRFFDKLSKTKIRKAMLGKARRHVLAATRDLMDNVYPVITRAKQPDQTAFAEKLLTDFVNTASMAAEEVLQRFDLKYPDADGDVKDLMGRIVESATQLSSLLSAFKPNSALMFPPQGRAVRDSLAELRPLLDKKVRALKRLPRIG